jgi:HAD superfamily hydrolase (TIGR01459 family)
VSFWDTLDPKYRLILCDVWGVVHDGVNLYPGAVERLKQWRSEGRCVVLITNAPRTAEAVEKQLTRIGLPRECWDAIATSGEAAIQVLRLNDKPIGFLGTEEDRAILEGSGVRLTSADTFSELACVGLKEERPRVEQYRADLERWVDRDVLMHCLNPDRVVIRGGVPEPCAGAIADVYEGLGGRVLRYGKPNGPVFLLALIEAGHPAIDEVLVVGDGLHTDMLGAAGMGFDAVFIRGGIHAGQPFPENFGDQNGFPGWQPVAVVDGLA